MRVAWRVLWKDDLLSKLRTVTDQLNIIQLDRDQLSTRLDQLQKVVQDVEEGKILTWSLTWPPLYTCLYR